MKLSTQPYKGTRDFYPEDFRVRQYIFDTWGRVCQSFGYEAYDAPAIEPMELYTAKTSEEIVNEQTFSFEDRGGRKVTLRPEMTPTVSRMVAARRQELGYPLRLYSIANFFRYERMQRGRSREFWQLNADLFGVSGIEADVENILLADSIMKAFGAQPGSYEIRVNSRNFIKQRSALAKPKDPNLTPNEVLRVLDTWSKDEDKARKKIETMFSKPEVIFGVMSYKDKEENESIFVDDLKEVLECLTSLGVSDLKYDATVARGFDYYTDIVFEVFDTNPDNNRSMFGGGRYDGLVGEFGVAPVPTVGFAMGDVTLQNFLESNKLLPELTTSNDLYLMVEDGQQAAAQGYAQKLRSEGKNVAVDLSGRKRDKQFKAAKKLGFDDNQVEWFEG